MWLWVSSVCYTPPVYMPYALCITECMENFDGCALILFVPMVRLREDGGGGGGFFFSIYRFQHKITIQCGYFTLVVMKLIFFFFYSDA